ncbi:MAG: Rossmann-like and DUF2520 domain-containing protein [Bacillota bacterium]
MSNPKITIIGAGKVGGALAVLLKERGYPVFGVASKRYESALELAALVGGSAFTTPEEAARGAGLIFITTPDREIENVSRRISERGGVSPGAIVAHTSGAHPSDCLAGVRERGGLAISIHPLQSFADLKTAMENIPGSFFALEGDREAMPVAERLVEDLEGRVFHIEAGNKVLYHAAACIASNYLVSLMRLSTGLLEGLGLSAKDSFQALLPLVQGTINNIEKVGPVQALTGPVARGDAPTIEGHLPALAEVGREEETIYRVLGKYTVRVALEKGSIGPEQAEILLKKFGEAF